LSLKINILANYASQIYVTLAGFILVPLYLKYMGAEAYGLVGFFAMLQAWFNLLDMGLTPTMARETARFRGGALDALTFRRLVRALEGVFLAVALIGGGMLLASSGWVATSWLTAQKLPITEVKVSIQLMAICVSLRWMGGLYRGQVSGAERFVWLSGYNTLIATLKFAGVVLVLMFISATPRAFFGYQLCVAVIELACLMGMAYRLLPPMPVDAHLAWSWAPLKPVLKFSLTIAFTSSVWVMVTQTDKLVLSKLLPLAEYGYFTMAVLVANGVRVMSGPICGAVSPRMARLEAVGNSDGLIQIYRQATQLVSIIAGAASITLALCAKPLLLLWSGDPVLAQHTAPILVLYALGNGILAVSAFPYDLQYAKGNLRLHLIGNAGFVTLLIPTIIWSASHYGGVGAGYTWLTMNLIYFVTWVPLVHSKFAPGLNSQWFSRDVLVIFAAAALAGFGLREVMPLTDNRWWQFIQIFSIGVFVMGAGASVSSVFWVKIRKLRDSGSGA
jgi:O-antigen/teichoic acid export membrane protein